MHDLAALVRLEERFVSDRISRAAFQRMLTLRAGARSFVLVASTHGVVVGDAVVHLRTGARVARLHSLVVDAAFEGRGVARALLEAMRERLASERCTHVRLTVRAGDARTRSLYARAGWSVRGERSGYYADGETGIDMESALHERRSSSEPDTASAPPVTSESRGTR